MSEGTMERGSPLATRIQLDRTGSAPLVTDGSMTIELARRGYPERPSDRYNLTIPAVIERIHLDFLDAGAEIIQSNTFSANRYALESSMMSARVSEINRKGVWLARAAANGRGTVAGVIGPTGRLMAPLGPLDNEEVLSCFFEQAKSLLAAHCDLVILKSFIDVDELEIAIKAVRKVSEDIALIALKSFPEDGSILSSPFPSNVAHRLEGHGVQAIGSNGTVGPQRMLGIVESLRVSSLPLVAIPDVGIPTIVDGIPAYDADPDYVAQAALRLAEAGASVIGADGGATVEHIRAIAAATRDTVVGIKPIKVAQPQNDQAAVHATVEPTPFGSQLGKRFLSTVELDIPRGLDMSSVLEGARYLKEHGIDAVNISDGARARLRMSPIAISSIVQSETGMECITHLACRDRNMVGLQSEVLGAHALGVRNILAVTGDPTHIGDFPSASSVYDIDSIGLVRALGRMNSGLDLMGNPLGRSTAFTIACAVNPAADDVEREVDRLAMKSEQGAHVAFSQPIFDPDVLGGFLDRCKNIDIRFMLGIIPLRTVRHAEFLHFEVPGMMIPDWVRKRMKEAGPDKERATDIGIEMAVDMLRAVRDQVDGVYLMPPFKKYDIAIRILDHVKQIDTQENLS
jgi:methionine synthase / methylenetetrahydrofolate reductase(NADPH)